MFVRQHHSLQSIRDWRRANSQGFTLLEIVVVLLIMCILAVMIYESYESFLSRAERVRCAANLRSLHVSLAAYTQDQNHWPQCPFELGNPQFDVWWMREMSRYNLGRRNWECPTYLRTQKEEEVDPKKEKESKKLIHYIPTPFDDEPRTPYKWPTQPWAVEIGDFHGDGNLILFPDGTIKGFHQFTSGRL